MRANAIPLPKAMYTNINPILFQHFSKQKNNINPILSNIIPIQEAIFSRTKSNIKQC